MAGWAGWGPDVDKQSLKAGCCRSHLHISSIASLRSPRGDIPALRRTSNSASSVTGLPLMLEHFPSSSSPLGKTVPSGDIQFRFVLLVNMKSSSTQCSYI